MKTLHSVALVDTLVDSTIVDVEKVVLLDDKMIICNESVNPLSMDNLSHGTLCAKILKNYDPDVALICNCL